MEPTGTETADMRPEAEELAGKAPAGLRPEAEVEELDLEVSPGRPPAEEAERRQPADPFGD